MFKKIQYTPYFSLLIFLFILCNLSESIVQRYRSSLLFLITPSWEQMYVLKNSLSFSGVKQSIYFEKEKLLQDLKTENLQLRQTLTLLQDKLFDSQHLLALSKAKEALEFKAEDDSFYKRRAQEFETLLHMNLQKLDAELIYRDPTHWNQYIWVQTLSSDDQVKRNSPVVVGNQLIGIVDEVIKNKAKVHLITDKQIQISVRTVRKQQNVKPLYLAKGEVFGQSMPLWRSRSQRLKGVGFNYHFEDVEGPARDLLSGKRKEHLLEDDNLTLIQVGDHLITTGLDGILPQGLQVGIVDEVAPLIEGAISYEIYAKIPKDLFETLRFVSILPPINEGEPFDFS